MEEVEEKTGAYFHIVNRGIDKGKIFFDDDDYNRFIIDLYRFNNREGAIRMSKREYFFNNKPEQNKLVDILKCTLLPNHYHLLVQEINPGDAVEFVKRLGNGYTKYINIKKDRSGYLFQNSAKIIQVITDRHFLYLPFYIELNVIDMVEPNWKEVGIKNPQKVINFIETYKWSSYKDCIGESNFPDILNIELFYETFNTNAKKFKEDVEDWIKDPKVSTWQVDTLGGRL